MVVVLKKGSDGNCSTKTLKQGRRWLIKECNILRGREHNKCPPKDCFNHMLSLLDKRSIL